MAMSRATDPITSHLAGRSVDLNRGQQIALEAFRHCEQMTDQSLVSILNELAQSNRKYYISESGARSRRAELTAAGIIVDTGETEVLPSGRRATVWALRRD